MTNAEYREQRNKLIPGAEKYANEKHGKKATGDRDAWVKEWNCTFLDKMDEFAREIGLINK